MTVFSLCRLSKQAYAELDAEVDASFEQLRRSTNSLTQLLSKIEGALSNASAPRLEAEPGSLGNEPNRSPPSSMRRRNSLSPGVISMLSSPAASGTALAEAAAGHSRRRRSVAELGTLGGQPSSPQTNKQQLDTTIIRAAMTNIFQSCLESVCLDAAVSLQRALSEAESAADKQHKTIQSATVWFDALHSNAVKTLMQHGDLERAESFKTSPPVLVPPSKNPTTSVHQTIAQMRTRHEHTEKSKQIALAVISRSQYSDVVFDTDTLVQSLVSRLHQITEAVNDEMERSRMALHSVLEHLRKRGTHAVQAIAAATQLVRGSAAKVQERELQALRDSLQSVEAQLESAHAAEAESTHNLKQMEDTAASMEDLSSTVEDIKNKLNDSEIAESGLRHELEMTKKNMQDSESEHKQRVLSLQEGRAKDAELASAEQAALVGELNQERAAFRAAKLQAEAELTALKQVEKDQIEQLQTSAARITKLEAERDDLSLQVQDLVARERLAEAGHALLSSDRTICMDTLNHAHDEMSAAGSPISPGLRAKILSLSPASAVKLQQPEAPIANALNRSIVAELARVRAIKAQERVDTTAAGLKVFVHRAQQHVLQAAETERSIQEMRQEVQNLEYQLDTKQSRLALSSRKMQGLQERLLSQHQELAEFQELLLQRAAEISVTAQAMSDRDAHLSRKEEALQSLEEQLEQKAAKAQYLGKLKLNLQVSSQQYSSPPAQHLHVATNSAEQRGTDDLSVDLDVSPVSTRPSSRASTEGVPAHPLDLTHAGDAQPASAEKGSKQAKQRWRSSVQQLRKVAGAVQFVTRVQTVLKSPDRAAPSPPSATESVSSQGSAFPAVSGAARRWSRLRRASSSLALGAASSSSPAQQSPVQLQRSASFAQQAPMLRQRSASFRSRSMRDIAAQFKQA